MLAAYLYYVKGHTKLNRQNHTLKNNPLGLVLWQGRRWSKAPTLPQCATKMQPLRVGLSKSSAYSRLYMLINQTTKAHARNTTPLGLAFWQGRVKVRSGLTLPQCATMCNPLGLVFQNIRGLAYYQWIISRFVGSTEMLTFAYARARSALGSIIHQLNLYHND